MKTTKVLLLMLVLPPLVYYAWFCIDHLDGALRIPTAALIRQIPGPTLASVLLYAFWFLLQTTLQILAPGKIAEGAPLTDGTRLKYKMNGWFSFWFTICLSVLVVEIGWIPATVLYDQFGALLTTVNIWAFGLSVLLYLHGHTSSTAGFYDYFMGTRLNPRVGNFDIKLFCEARPGLILWVLMDLSFAAKQYQSYGTVTTPMILVNAFQFLYIADYFFHEEAILTTWDIKYEKFGWMLCWGDLVWVPFMYTIQARYLVHHTHELSIPAVIGIVVLDLLGYTIFRGANIQKHKFRRDPKIQIWGKPAEYIETGRGSLLLTSGWWGIARHSNYLGDLLMGLAWCLPAGFAHPLPYFYIFYFTILLVHREWRDNAVCRKKYGTDWDAYCARVRWRIVPGIY